MNDTASLFDKRCGSVCEPEIDGKRLGKQCEKIRDYMLKNSWKTLAEIEEVLGYPQASISAQLRHLRKERFGGYGVEKHRRLKENGEPGGTWEYLVWE